ncbi:hypothetical protein [Massilia rubra]|uniref:Uncharacterized protein n=1 Tax=Massilia rubra TaxID=2607910 RepID=A0ABX0LRK4_9BURK|nr:hypothetical protein [Massilia rubra]NHZ37178.1 hypothetical protein [Massilia rubra]
MGIWKIGCAAALALNMGTAHAVQTPASLRAAGLPISNLVLLDEGNASMTVIGEITPALLASFRAIIVEHPEVTQLYIDSQGGELPSALEMARIIDQRNLSLVVDGRCFSACANYLFVAARRKSVLPGSMVGIHELSATYVDAHDNSLRKIASGHEADREMQTAFSADRLKQWHEARRQEQDFYRDFGIRQDLHNAYADYVSNRKKSLGVRNINIVAGNPQCPRLRSWILSREQLSAIGVKGIERFWFPRNDREKQGLYKAFGLPPDSLYVGSPANLRQYCTGFAGSAMVRQWYALHDLIKGR